MVFEKIYECLFIPNCREKSFDYLLIIYMKKFLHADWWKNFEMVEKKESTRITQFGVFEKFTSAYLFQIAQEKSCDYLLII